MSGKITWKIYFYYAGVVLFGILVGILATHWAGNLWNGGGKLAIAQAAAAVPVVVQASDSPEDTFICTPSYIGAFSTRVHVLCTLPAPGGIYYFAAPTSDSKNAARVLSILLTAKSLGKTLQIYFNPSGDGSAFGCQMNDCRPITAIEMTN